MADQLPGAEPAPAADLAGLERLNRLLEPIYGPVRSILPNTGGLDLAPLVVFIGIIILQRALANNAAWFYGF